MSKTTLYGKCPRCCPDGGACFSLYSETEKQCNNCHLVLTYRRVKPTGKITRSQQQELDYVLSVFGGTVTEQSFIGRKLWVVIENRDRSWVLGERVYGAIGPAGKLELKLQRLGPEAQIKDRYDVRGHLTDYSEKYESRSYQVETLQDLTDQLETLKVEMGPSTKVTLGDNSR